GARCIFPRLQSPRFRAVPREDALSSWDFSVWDFFGIWGLDLGISYFLKFLNGSRPILFQQQRQRAICQQLPSGLAAWTVVRLIVRIANPLHGRTANRAWLPEFAMHRHIGSERGDLLRKRLAGFAAQTHCPSIQRLLGRRVQAIDFVLREF